VSHPPYIVIRNQEYNMRIVCNVKNLNKFNTKMTRLLFTALLMLACQFLMTAQTNVPDAPVMAAQLTAKGIPAENLSFFADEEEAVFYIDFESISLNLNEVVIKDKEGATVFMQKVSDLPVDTIYELDYSQFNSGQYFVELHSYTDILQSTFSVK